MTSSLNYWLTASRVACNLRVFGQAFQDDAEGSECIFHECLGPGEYRAHG